MRQTWPPYARLRGLWHGWLAPRHTFQPYGDTAMDRHPALFQQCRQILGDGPGHRLLSFGCATGEEVLTLRRYFPQATLVGVDVNPRRIDTARRQVRHQGGDAAITFQLGHTAPPGPPFDAVFCLSVFRHGALQWGPAPRCDRFIRHAEFQRTVAGLIAALRPGGLLAVWGNNFRVRDTALLGGLSVVSDFASPIPDASTPIYGPDDRLMPGVAMEGTLFRRRSGSRLWSCPGKVESHPPKI